METALKAWFGNVEVVREGSTPLDPADRYIFGYTPHGLFPIGEVACLGCCHASHCVLMLMSTIWTFMSHSECMLSRCAYLLLKFVLLCISLNIQLRI